MGDLKSIEQSCPKQTMASRPDQPGTPARRRPAALATGQQPHHNILTPPVSPAAGLLHHTMRNSAVDLFVLTFNCAKTVIDVDVFAAHLRGALVQHGGPARGVTEVELPDLVVLCVPPASRP